MSLSGQIERYLEMTRSSVAAAMDDLEMPLSETVTVPIGSVKDDSRGAWTIAKRSIAVSPLHAGVPNEVKARLGTLRTDLSRSIAQSLVGRFADDLRYSRLAPVHWNGERADEFEHDPVTWTELAYLVPTAEEYLARLTDIATDESELRRHLAEELLAFASSGTRRRVSMVGVFGFDLADHDVRWGPLRVRRVGETEAAALACDPRLADLRISGEELLTGWHFVRAWMPSHVLEVEEHLPKEGDSGHPARAATSVVVALALLGYHLVGPERATAQYRPNWTGGRSHFAVPVSTQDQRKHATKPVVETVLHEASELAEAIRGYDLDQPRSREAVALHRVALALTRESSADQLIDSVIALESLLLPPSDRGELAYRFRLHGALLIGNESSDERFARYGDLKEVYNARSKLVHGTKPPSQEVLDKQAALALELAAEGLRRALHGGWPTQETFTRWILSDP